MYLLHQTRSLPRRRGPWPCGDWTCCNCVAAFCKKNIISASALCLVYRSANGIRENGLSPPDSNLSLL